MGSPLCQHTALLLSSSALRESNPSLPLWGTPPKPGGHWGRAGGSPRPSCPICCWAGHSKGAELPLVAPPAAPSRARAAEPGAPRDGAPEVPAGIRRCRRRWARVVRAGSAPGWSRDCSCFSSLLFVLPKRVGCHLTDTTGTPSRPAPGDPGLAQRETPGGEATLEPTVPVPGGTNPDTSWDPAPVRDPRARRSSCLKSHPNWQV